MATKVLTLVGSLRNGSTNQQLAEATSHNAPEGMEVSVFSGLENIPFYNEDTDVEGGVPAAAQALRDAAAEADALMLVTPEYNGTMPAVLKNAIDWLSRPFGAGAVSGMPTVVVGTAFGQYGGVWAQDEARKALNIAGAKVLEDVKLAIPNSVVRFAELHPKDDAEVVEQVTTVLNSIKEIAEAN
ncbi:MULTISPECIES: NAD(P)H-dependent oxidoreductase [Glutamicibacter]|uniref:NAD(P)H-dependent oxidoreductase n=1 Tax=Glutamicibacter halophytocola TaxID=1933880 RepID=A0A5B8IZX3_9MICC|nr:MULTISPECIES: NAD(P)H-dependent oxidoreductase [Glutamicibacter]MBF6671090.1 NAD(P)H-dependent oxidoreductase [Glutamicibacter sp. FBE19]NQD41290.1 NAD(P)H-dependent oxidoreductase [Glutamicibacter halophytocola]QDY67757.1 NAD(P)H-dependent oxidoreductase [Glutamicibacter halophytocola]UUX59930.1 NAD(P)H-dependent oxidoreductase [Glutamicibacter halophytocola]